MKKKTHKHNKYQLTLMFVLIIFCTLLITSAFMYMGVMLLYYFKIDPREYRLPGAPLMLLALLSIILGLVVSLLFSRMPIQSIQETIAAIDRLAEGDYNTRLNLPEFTDEISNMNRSFNHLAEELSGVEMLRSDFVNNFSHEFKTPIVSIRGFARVLRNENLSENERMEYLDIIIRESERLADLSTSILYLSKVENQIILNQPKTINISEGIRLALVLLEKEWSKKQLQILFEAPEIFVEGDPEMLQQVWLNLIGNAIKFSPKNSDIQILLSQNSEETCFTIINASPVLDNAVLSHMFDKFYQGDPSHSKEGNGLGLSLVWQIIRLHGGKVWAEQKEPGELTIQVRIPSEKS